MPFAIAPALTAISGIAAGGAVTLGAVGTIAAGASVATGLSLGVVGLATGDKSLAKLGGVLGLAGGVVSAGSSLFGEAASLGTDAATGALGSNALISGQAPGTGIIGQEAAKAITPTFQGITEPTAAAATSSLPTQIQGTGLLAQASNSITPGFSTPVNPVGNVATATAPSAPTAPKVGGFFDNITAPQATLINAAATIGGGILSKAYEGQKAENEYQIERQKQDIKNQEFANQNLNPNFEISVAPVTGQQRQDAAIKRAELIKQRNQILYGDGFQTPR